MREKLETIIKEHYPDALLWDCDESAHYYHARFTAGGVLMGAMIFKKVKSIEYFKYERSVVINEG